MLVVNNDYSIEYITYTSCKNFVVTLMAFLANFVSFTIGLFIFLRVENALCTDLLLPYVFYCFLRIFLTKLSFAYLVLKAAPVNTD